MLLSDHSFNTMSGATQKQEVKAGVKQARFTGLLRNTTYWVAVHPIDVVGNQPAALISYPVELKDKLAPDEVAQGWGSLATGLALE